MDADVSVGRSERSREKSRAVELEPPRYIHDANGVLIIEEIETPATRREKQRRNKAKRMQLLENEDIGSSVSTSALLDGSRDGDDDDLSSVLTPPPESDTEDAYADTDKSLASIGDTEQADARGSSTNPNPPAQAQRVTPMDPLVMKKSRAPRTAERGFFQIGKRERIPEGTMGEYSIAPLVPLNR